MVDGTSKNPISMLRIPVWLAMVVIALAPGIIFAPPLLGGKTIGPFEQMRSMVIGAPAGSTNDDRAWDILQADGALQFYGWRNLVFQAHKSGKAPVWNPMELAGTPLLANSQSAPYYPLHLIPAVFKSVSTGPYLVLLAWFHLAVAGLGTFCLSRRLGAGVEGALFAGVALALSPFAVAWSALASVMTACAWIPVILAAQAAVFDRVTVRSWLGLAASGLMLFSAGHLQFIFYGGLAWLLFAIGTLAATKGGARLAAPVGMSALAMLLGLALAWPQIGATLAFSKLSHRKTVASEEGYAAYAASAIQPWEFVGTLTPVFMGTPGHFDADDVPEKIPSTWMMYVKPGGNYAESAIWLGVPVVLGLCLLGRKTDWRKIAPLFAVGGVGLLLALGTPLARLFYFAIPGFASTGSPGRASFLFVLAACVVAGIALPHDESKADPKAKAYPYFALLGVALATILASSQLGGISSWLQMDLHAIVARRVTEALPILVASLVVAAGAWFAWCKKGWLAVGTVCAVVAQLIAIPLGVLPFSELPKAQIKEDPSLRVANINAKWDFFAPPRSALMPPNFSTILGPSEIGGYDSLLAKSTVDILRVINKGQDPAPPTNGNMMFVKPDFDATALSDAGVTQVRSKYPITGLIEERTLGDAHVYALPGPGIASSGDNRLSVRVDTEGFSLSGPMSGHVVARFARLPGWRATQSGRDLPITGDKWLEVDPVDSSAPIRFDYLPPGLPPLASVRLIAWSGAILALVSLVAQVLPLKRAQITDDPVESKASVPDSE